MALIGELSDVARGMGMKFNEFMGALRKEIPHVCLLAGEEHYYVDKAVDAMKRRLFPDGAGEDAIERVSGDMDIDQLIGLVETVPFFSDKNVIIVQEPPFFKAAGGKKKDTQATDSAKGKKTADKKIERLQQLIASPPSFSYVIFLDRKSVV